MLLATAGPLYAFTLSSPSLGQPVLKAPIENVWWNRWGRWHPNGWGWHPWGWGWQRPVYGYYGAPMRRCWVGPWGGWHCV
jgi:hypothetical protein